MTPSNSYTVIEYSDYMALGLFMVRLVLVMVTVYLFLMSVLFFRKESQDHGEGEGYQD